ncbi:NAD(P)-binding protein [Agrocybe pediades]|nr:NAD(P)-binding protein [Agrocybe pediades]
MDSNSQPSPESRAALMRDMVKKYTSDFAVRAAGSDGVDMDGKPTSTRDVVLVTGTTGSIGSLLLAELVHDPSVSRVYAVNRPHQDGSSMLADRQKKALLGKGLDVENILSSNKVRLIEADISLSGWAVPENVYTELRRSVTHILHNAWPGDLSLPLEAFEPCISGLKNLIDFALSSSTTSPPPIVFVSTTGVFQNIKYVETTSLTESPIAPEVSAGNGYTESKWIAEEVLRVASSQTTLNSVIVRVGQVCGGGPNGYWNTAEWFPAIVQSGPVLGCIATDDRNSSLIPLHITARSLVDYLAVGDSATNSCTTVHLVHPNPIPFSALATTIAEHLSVELVPFSEWLKNLEAHATEEQTNSKESIAAEKMLFVYHYLTSKFNDGADAFGFHRFECNEGTRLSKTLASAPQLGRDNVIAWLSYWKSVGFIKDVN